MNKIIIPGLLILCGFIKVSQFHDLEESVFSQNLLLLYASALSLVGWCMLRNRSSKGDWYDRKVLGGVAGFAVFVAALLVGVNSTILVGQLISGAEYPSVDHWIIILLW